MIKFLLHISKEEQRQRLLSRLDDPSKRWKFNPGDVTERAFWDYYMKAYADCLAATSSNHSPWYVLPADDKPNARILFAQVLVDTLKDICPEFPELDLPASEVDVMRKQLESAS